MDIMGMHTSGLMSEMSQVPLLQQGSEVVVNTDSLHATCIANKQLS
jgi:hypothetical protein